MKKLGNFIAKMQSVYKTSDKQLLECIKCVYCVILIAGTFLRYLAWAHTL